MILGYLNVEVGLYRLRTKKTWILLLAANWQQTTIAWLFFSVGGVFGKKSLKGVLCCEMCIFCDLPENYMIYYHSYQSILIDIDIFITALYITILDNQNQSQAFNQTLFYSPIWNVQKIKVSKKVLKNYIFLNSLIILNISTYIINFW